MVVYKLDHPSVFPLLLDAEEGLVIAVLDQMRHTCEWKEDYLMKFFLVNLRYPNQVRERFLNLEHFPQECKLIKTIRNGGMETPNVNHIQGFVFLFFGRDYLSVVD